VLLKLDISYKRHLGTRGHSACEGTGPGRPAWTINERARINVIMSVSLEPVSYPNGIPVASRTLFDLESYLAPRGTLVREILPRMGWPVVFVSH
jgi:hypothetical protein